MSKDDKLVARLKRRPPLASYTDVCRLLELYGWTMRKAGEHTAVYAKPGEPKHITIATVKGRSVKRYKIDEILEILGLLED